MDKTTNVKSTTLVNEWRQDQKDRQDLDRLWEERAWQQLPPHHPEPDTLPGSKIKMYPSPYDLPQKHKMVLGTQGWWSLGWSFIDNAEPLRTLDTDDVVAHYGKNSGRLYRLSSLNPDADPHKVIQAWLEHSSSSPAHQARMVFLADRFMRKLKMQIKNGSRINPLK